jgi:hypothetical protein
MTFRALGAAAALLVLGGTVAGCAQKQYGPPCPPVYLLADARHVTEFRPHSPHDLVNMVATGDIVGWKGACGFQPAGDGKSAASTVALQVTVKAVRGPANKDRQAHFSYFVAIPAFFPKPQAKAVFDVTVPFPDGIDTVSQTDAPVALTIPVKSVADIAHTPIYLGFQTSPSQLRYNRRNK